MSRAARQRAILVFLTFVLAAVVSAVTFVQSARFARIAKSMVARNTPKEWGIRGDFSEFRVHLFPPGIAIENPRVTLEENNIVSLPAGSTVAAERIDLRFYPLQMLSGNVRVHEAAIIKGVVRLSIDPDKLALGKDKSSPVNLSWDELVQVRAESLVFEDTKVELTFSKPKIRGEFMARRLELSQKKREGISGYELSLAIEDGAFEWPAGWKIPKQMNRLSTQAWVGSTGAVVDDLRFAVGDAEAVFHGRITGDLLRPDKLPFDAGFELRGSVAKLAESFQLDFPEKELSGNFSFKGSAAGDLVTLGKTLAFESDVEALGIQFRSWKADTLKARFGMSSAGDGAWRLSVERGEVASAALVRTPPHQPGHGGMIRVGAFKTLLGAHREGFTVPATLEDVHLHWLATPALKSVYPLDFRVSGPVRFDVGWKAPVERGGDAWSVQADLDLKIPIFQLDNQFIGMQRPLRRLLAIPNLTVRGQIGIGSKAVQLKRIDLDLPNSHFQATGKVDFKTGYDISASGTAKLPDIGILAETPIIGEGKISALVRGPAEHVVVDFDVDLQNTEYLSLKLGGVQGRIRYDDGDHFVELIDAKVTKPDTVLTGNGKIVVGAQDRINLRFTFPRGAIQDLNHIFTSLTSDIWWFPSAIVGDASGSIDVKGGLDLSELTVTGDIRGESWDYYGERFRSLSMRGGYDRRRYFVDRVIAKKNEAILRGNISYAPTSGFSWTLASENLRLRDLDHVARLDVPIRGNLRLQSEGFMSANHVKSESLIELDDFWVRGVRLPASRLNMQSAAGILTADGRANGEQGRLKLAYDFKPQGKSHLEIETNKLDFSPILLLLNPRLMTDSELMGLVSGSLDLKFESGASELGSGSLAVRTFDLRKTGVALQLVRGSETKIQRGLFELGPVRFEGVRGGLEIMVAGRESGLSGYARGDADMGLAQFLTPVIETSSGKWQPSLRFSGKLKEPKVDGAIEYSDGSMRLLGLETPLSRIRGRSEVRDGTLTIRSLDADLAGGPVVGRGTIEFFWSQLPKINVWARLTDNRLKIFPFQSLQVKGDLSVKGDHVPYRIAGDLFATSGLIREKILQSGSSRGPKMTAKFTPAAVTLREGDQPTFLLDVRLRADDRIFVRNDLFDAEMRGDIRLINTFQAPRLLGEASMIRGSLSFKGREFDLKSGRADFDNPAVIDPKFDLTGTTQVADKKIQLYAHGRVSKWKIEFSSEPPLPEPEIVSLLALGFTADELRKFNAADQTALQQGEAASLLLHASDFNRDVREKTGLELQVEQSEDIQAGQSVFRPQTEESGAGAAPKVVVKRKLGKKFGVSVGSTVGTGKRSEQEFNAEVNVTPNASVIGVWESFEGVETPDGQTSFGVDFKLQKRFK